VIRATFAVARLRRNAEAAGGLRPKKRLMSRLFRAALAVVAAFALLGPASSDALSLQHRDDVQHGFRALTQTFYRGVEPAKLVAGARRGIADAAILCFEQYLASSRTGLVDAYLLVQHPE